MITLKDYNKKIESLSNTQKITRTMKMISASKLRKVYKAQAEAKLYAKSLTAMIVRISTSVESETHPLLMSRKNVQRVLILIITSDKGLCGAFNHNANRCVDCWIKENRHHHEQIDLSCCGKKGFMYFQKREKVKTHYDNVTSNPRFSDAKRIGADLSRSFLRGEYDEIYLSYNQFFNPFSQKTVFEKILPIDPYALSSEKLEKSREYIFEPAASELLAFLFPHFLYFKIYFALLENSAGEHGARMTAMDSATKNSAELIEKNILYRNRVRQAQITRELIEITGGAEALK